MTFLQTAKAVVGTESLVAELHDRLSKHRPERSYHKVHLSDLTNTDRAFCPREFALLRETKGERKAQFLSASLRVTFDVGNAIHDLAREVWFQDMAVGNWRCVGCRGVVKFSRHPGVMCPHCKAKTRFQYLEVPFRDPETDVTGSVDLLVDFDIGRPLIVVECKSIDKDAFKELKAPQAEHRMRVDGYLQLIARTKTEGINTDYGYVLYVSKSFGFKDAKLAELGVRDRLTPFKEYKVHRTDKGLDAKWELARQVKQYDDTGEIPCRICDTAMVTRARQCSVAKHCFSEKYS